MDTRVDHFMYAVPSLDEGLEWASDTFGVEAAYGGEHVGGGTRNALLSLGSAYLEIIAPDPAQAQEGTFGERLATLSRGGLVTWAAEGQLTGIGAALSEQKIKTAGPITTQRKTTAGDLLIWELLFPTGSVHGGRLPFFIDWLACANPKETNPKAGRFESLSITTHNAEDLSKTLKCVGLELPVEEGEPSLSMIISTKRGDVTLKSTTESSQFQMR
jgi:hypothetical protein